MLCKICIDSGLSFDDDNIFFKKGFSSWNKALERFKTHENSKDYRAAVSNFSYKKIICLLKTN